MAKDILKEAIADAKAVREVALANAKAALEEAFTPKLQSMLSAKLSEDLDEDVEETYMDEADDMEETYYDEAIDKDDVDETVGMETEAEVGDNVDETIDLEEILNELGLEEAIEEDTVAEGEEDVTEGNETVDEAKKKKSKDDKKDDKEEVDEAVGYPNYRADQISKVKADATDVNQGLNESEEFNLDALLKEIESLEEKEDDDSKKEAKDNDVDEISHGMDETATLEEDLATSVAALIPLLGVSTIAFQAAGGKEGLMKSIKDAGGNKIKGVANFLGKTGAGAGITGGGRAEEAVEKELEETKAALETVRNELNEVNLLNSKLLYVNRIFKANQLDESQKLRVVETLDKAESTKEAKLIYETIKDTFNVANAKKASKKAKAKSLKEGIGIASKAAGTSTAPKKEVIAESNDMISRFQKLANIKINE